MQTGFQTGFWTETVTLNYR